MAVDEVKPDDKKVENETDELLAPDVELEAAPLLEPVGKPETDQARVHPLTPGGRRFEQVYAEGKQAKRDLAKERDLRIAAEARLEEARSGKVVSDDTSPKEEEYSWAQLEEFIAHGKISRADAEAHRESVIERRLSKKIKGDFTKESYAASRGQALQSTISDYVKVIPAILTEGSDDRLRVDEEFDFLASIQGVDTSKIDDTTRKTLQLTALRAVYGPIDVLTKRTTAVKPDTQRELPGGLRVQPSKNPDQALLDGLTKSEVVHYTKMIHAGRYPLGWKDVVAELKFVAPKQVRR